MGFNCCNLVTATPFPPHEIYRRLSPCHHLRNILSGGSILRTCGAGWFWSGMRSAFLGRGAFTYDVHTKKDKGGQEIPQICGQKEGSITEVARFLRNHGSQFLFWGNHATRIGGSIPEELRLTIPLFGESCHL